MFGEVERYLVDCVSDRLEGYGRPLELIEDGVEAVPGLLPASTISFEAEASADAGDAGDASDASDAGDASDASQLATLRGSLAVTATREVLLALLPEEHWTAPSPLPKLLANALEELTRSLAEGVVRGLRRHGLAPTIADVRPAAPNAAQRAGADAGPRPGVGTRRNTYRFLGGDVDLHVTLELTLGDDFVLGESDAILALDASEGEAIFY